LAVQNYYKAVKNWSLQQAMTILASGQAVSPLTAAKAWRPSPFRSSAIRKLKRMKSSS